MCCSCGRETKLDEVSRPRTHLYEANGAPFMYLLHFECSCGSTMSHPLWQDEESTAEELAAAEHEQAGAELYERDETPLDRAAFRPFFSLTHELASRGL